MKYINLHTQPSDMIPSSLHRRSKHLFKYSWLFLLLILNACNSGPKNKTPQPSTILSTIQQQADLVTTQLTIRKIAYYDTSLHERLSLTDPSTWKYGDRKCIVPVEVSIKYGYDLRELTIDNVKVNDSLRIIEVILPQPRVIDSGYSSAVDPNSVVSISTGLRDPIGHETIEKIRSQAYQAVMKEDFRPLIGNELKHNAQTLFQSLALSMGFSGCTIRES